MLTQEQVLSAVEGRRKLILQHAATVTPAQLFAWLREDLGLPDDEPLKPHRKAVKQRALHMLEDRGQLPFSGGPAIASDIPADVLPAVFRHLDHDTLFCALQVCKAWRVVGSAPEAALLWQQQFSQRGWQWQQQRQQTQQKQQTQQQTQQRAGEEQQGGAAVDWRERYRQQYRACCFECFQPTERHTLTAGTLRLRLCRACSSAYASPRPHHRLLPASAAKQKCCMKDADLALLPRCVEPNPVQPAFQPMHLYRRLDVRRAAVGRWGSWEAVQGEYRQRLTR